MQKKRKVLFVVHQLNYGGVQKSILSALDAVDYSENEVVLYIRKNRIQLLPEVNKNVSNVIINEDQTHYYRKPYMIYLQLYKVLCQLLRLKRKVEDVQQKIVTYLNESQMEYERKHYFSNGEEYDVAISYIQGYTTQFVAQYISAKKKIMFYHVSSDERHELHEKVMQYFDWIVGVNENIKEILCELYPSYSEKMTFLDNYVNADDIRMKSKESTIQKERDRIVLCSCGRLAMVKGFDLAVEAAKILNNKGLVFLWYFVGDGPERKKLEQMIAEYELGDSVKITGMQDNPYSYIGGCDIYVQPSYEESFGLTIAEAKILNKPIVSTKTVGANKQIMDMETGILTDISGKALAKGILQYIDCENLKQEIISNLEVIDYSVAYEQYRLQWSNLLKD